MTSIYSIRRLSAAFSSVLLPLLVAAGCSKETLDGAEAVECVLTLPSGAETRTEYRPGSWVSGSFSLIDWVEGDRVRLYSPEAATSGGDHFSDFTASPMKGDRTRSSLFTRYNLNWRDNGEHSFYGLYPAPVSDNASALLAGLYGRFTFAIPAVIADGQQMRYAVMAGAAEGILRKEDGPVVIPFYPAFSSFEIMLEGIGDRIFYLNEVSIESSDPAGEPLSGTLSFRAQDGLPTIEGFSGTGASVTVAFGGDGIALKGGLSTTALLITLPVNLTAATLVIKRTYDGEMSTFRLPLKKDGTWVQFPAFGRHRITGVVSPEATDLITVNSNTVDWNRLPDINTDVLP